MHGSSVSSVTHFSFSLRFSGHFPGEPGLASTRMSPFWILLQLRMTEVVVTTGAIRRAKLQLNHHQQTSIQRFTGWMPCLSPNQQCQSTEGMFSNFGLQFHTLLLSTGSYKMVK